jgi:hypothetical protein
MFSTQKEFMVVTTGISTRVQAAMPDSAGAETMLVSFENIYREKETVGVRIGGTLAVSAENTISPKPNNFSETKCFSPSQITYLGMMVTNSFGS